MAEPSRAFRKAVAELAVLPQRDIDAILAALPEAQSRRIRELLGTFFGKPSVRGFPHLSDWLAHKAASGEGLTPAAAALLADCARKTTPDVVSAPDAVTPSLISRLLGRGRAA